MEWRESEKKFRGSLSVVFKASYAGVKVAAKRIKKASLNPDFNDEAENVLKLLDHPNVLKLYSVVHKSQCKYDSFFLNSFCSSGLII